MARVMSLAGAFAVAFAFARAAQAGPADPVPLLNGTTRATHVFTGSGVRIDANTGLVVLCTSLEKSKDVMMAVEVFQWDATVLNDVATGIGVSLMTAPGRTITWEVKNDGGGIAYTFGDVSIPSVGNVFQGSFRVLSTSTKITCSAANIDRTNSPPNFVWPLNLIAKTKQKGV